jgi:hypothetical protein
MTMLTYEDALARLVVVSQRSDYANALCPAHDDHSASLTVTRGDDGKLLLYCHKGCKFSAILAELKRTPPDLTAGMDHLNGHGHAESRRRQRPKFSRYNVSKRWFPARHAATGRACGSHGRADFTDAEGKLDKAIWWEDLDCPLEEVALWNAEALKDRPYGSRVYVVEGEQKCNRLNDALRAADVDALAVATMTGAEETPCVRALAPLLDYDVVLWPDNDKPDTNHPRGAGQQHMERIVARLTALGAHPRWVDWPDAPDKGDVADFLAAGHTVAELEELIGDVPVSEEKNDDQGDQSDQDGHDQGSDDENDTRDKAGVPPNDAAILADLAERAKADRGVAFAPNVLEALVRLQRRDTAAWVRVREELRKAGVPLRELEKAIRRAAWKVVRGGQDGPEDGGAPTAGSTPYRLVAGPYRLVNGAICLEKDQRDPLGPGATVSVPLCNFAARIAAEEVHDDGAEQTTILVIEGKLQDGEALPHARIPADRYAGMAWVTANWGARAVVYAGQAMKDHLRAAVQLLSGAPPRTTIYGHTGWRKVDGAGWVYLHAGGGLGAQGAEPSIQVDLPDALSRYVLPEPPEGDDLAAAIRASLGVLDVAPDVVTIPLYASIWRAVLGAVDLSVHLHGHTGEGKTELVTLIQQHYGAGMGTRELPANWSSTANALEALAFQAKDAILVVDDFVPHGSTADVQRFHRDADRLFRAQGNASGRQRMTADSRLRPAKRPRGLILSTGEEVPHGQSLRARLLILEHVPGTLDWDKLTVCQQHAASGCYAEALAGFLQWLAPQYDGVREGLRGELVKIREKAARGVQHKRTPEIVANLGLGVRYFLAYAVEKGAITTDERDALAKRTWKTLGEVAAAQARYQSESEPTRRFIELLRAAIASGKAHLAAQMGQEPVTPEAWGWRHRTIGAGENSREEWQPQGARIGWFDGASALYLEPEAAYAAAQAVGQQVGDGLTITAQTLRRRLHQRGLLVSIDPSRETLTIRRVLEGKSRDVLHLSPATLFPSPEPDNPDKHSHNEGDEGAGPAECRVSPSGNGPPNAEPDIDPTSAGLPESWADSSHVGFVGFPTGERASPETTHIAGPRSGMSAEFTAGWAPKPDSETRHRSPTPTAVEVKP